MTDQPNNEIVTEEQVKEVIDSVKIDTDVSDIVPTKKGRPKKDVPTPVIPFPAPVPN